MVDSLPGGIDDSASYVYDPLKHKSDDNLKAQITRIQEELKRRAEEVEQLKFPITWDEFSLYCTRDDRYTDADNLGLDGDVAQNFAYAGREVTFRVTVTEGGDVTATHIRYGKDRFLPLPEPMKMN